MHATCNDECVLLMCTRNVQRASPFCPSLSRLPTARLRATTKGLFAQCSSRVQLPIVDSDRPRAAALLCFRS